MPVGKIPLNDAISILEKGNLGRLGCIAEGEPYVIPVNYFYDGKYIYIHSMPGRKINALRSNPRACLQIDEIVDSYNWRSVIAYGSYEEISDEDTREQILESIFKRVPQLTPVETKMAKSPEKTIIFRLMVDQITGVGEHW
ncbi:MAG: pyridoxamine 5'-phosphate oxidase family protein [Acidobacteria bacterium]|jgi:nitroimidazol reductase NimA-like FMN-containing flavoprotein (pyridoxamine 5'-phosphate oxidase superfamily)|nr:pyridoxamine 5'-phosphate oxidase family protein [Acidobacteriota bacterium]